MIKKFVYIVVILFYFAVSAQVPTSEILVDTQVFPKERVSLITNSNLLLAGELLEYKAFVQNTDNNRSTLSKIVYVSMRNQNDSVVFDHKLKLENGVANGDFFIPATLKTGVYNLVGYTNFSRNNVKDALAQKAVYVINTFQKARVVTKTSDAIEIKAISQKENNLSAHKSEAGTINISSDKSTYGPREKVGINLERTIKNLEGNYVLSVRRIDPISISNKSLTTTMVHNENNFYLPEIRGEIISGTVKSNTDRSVAVNKVVALTIPGKNHIFKLAKTNKNGRFFFSIAEPYEAENVILQINEIDRANYILSLDKRNLSIKEEKGVALKLDSSLANWLQERSIELQVDNAYFTLKKDSILSKKPLEPFYDNLGTNYVLDDYTRFPTVRETFIEVIQTAAIRNVGDEHRFLVYNEYDPNGSAKFNSLDPLVLVDGILLQDNEELLNYSANNIWSIRVITEPYRYGPKIYSGLIAVTTKKNDFEPILKEGYVQKFKTEPALPEKISYQPTYSENKNLARIPDYRVQLYWNPNIKLNPEDSSISFYTSDVTGLFKVTLEGYTNTGEFISVKNYFKVKGK